MVVQSKTASDSSSISDSISKLAIGGTGNVSINAPSDSITITESVSQSTVTLKIDKTYSHLNGRDIHKTSVDNATNIEKVAIVTATFGTISYTTGGVPLDFTKVSGIEPLPIVYLCKVTGGTQLYTRFVPASDNNSKNGKLMFYDSSGVELTNANSSTQNLILQLHVRGR